MDHNNSLSNLLAGILRRETNSLNLINLLSEIYQSKDTESSMVYFLPDGTQESISIPSYGFLISEIKRLSDNIDNMSGINVDSASIKMADGSIRMIFGSELPIEYPATNGIELPTTFHIKENETLEKISPKSMFTEISVNNISKQGSRSVVVNKFVLEIDTPDKLIQWNKISNANIAHDEFVSMLEDFDINHQNIESTSQISPKLPRFKGGFDVTRFYKKKITLTNNTDTIDKLVYVLDKLTYTDLDGRSILLNVDDQLILNNDGIRNTIYKIDYIDHSKNEIGIKLIQGNGYVGIGTDIFVIDPGYDNSSSISVPVLRDQKLCIFVRPINPNGNIYSPDLGFGICFDTNLLSYDDGSKLSDQVSSRFANNLYNLANDKILAIEDAIDPNVPILNPESFKVLPINLHKKDSENLEGLRKKTNEKNLKKTEIESIDNSISLLKSKLSDNKLSDKEIDNLQKNIKSEYDKRGLLVKEYSSLVSDILARKGDISKFAPKYEIRGFWNIPDPQYKNNNPQYICSFEYRYRYNKIDGTSTETDSFNIIDQNNNVTKASYSKWELVKTVPMKKIIKDGVVSWENGDQKDPDVVNSNQLGISISYGEQVEIQVRSISEVGYPSANIHSNWSESLTIPFPTELNDQFDFALADMTNEQIKAEFLNEMRTMGVDKHIEDSFFINEKYFSHHADNIATEFRTPENRNKTVSQKISEHESEIEKLKAIINGDKPKMAISILDESGNLIQTVTNNDTISLFAGYYKDIVSNLSIQKGAIVNKLYYLEISNASAIDLELLSYVPGDSADEVPNLSTYEGYIISSEEYNKYRKYFDVPIILKGMTPTNPLLLSNHQKSNPYVELPTFGSRQTKGCYVYSRKFDLALSESMYVDDDIMIPTNLGSSSTSPFVWDGSITTSSPSGNGLLSHFCIHTDHPYLVQNSDFMQNFAEFFTNNIPNKNIKNGNPIYPLFSNTKLAVLKSSDVNGEKQQQAIRYQNTNSIANIKDFPTKLGFNRYDQYLIGKNTVGAYLYLAPNFYTDISTNQIIYNQGKILAGSDKIRIPIIFSARLTDYHGAGSTGTGIIGGFGSPATLNNITYAKRIGIDIPIKNQGLFSFDLRIEMQYNK